MPRRVMDGWAMVSKCVEVWGDTYIEFVIFAAEAIEEEVSVDL